MPVRFPWTLHGAGRGSQLYSSTRHCVAHEQAFEAGRHMDRHPAAVSDASCAAVGLGVAKCPWHAMWLISPYSAGQGARAILSRLVPGVQRGPQFRGRAGPEQLPGHRAASLPWPASHCTVRCSHHSLHRNARCCRMRASLQCCCAQQTVGGTGIMQAGAVHMTCQALHCCFTMIHCHLWVQAH